MAESGTLVAIALVAITLSSPINLTEPMKTLALFAVALFVGAGSVAAQTDSTVTTRTTHRTTHRHHGTTHATGTTNARKHGGKAHAYGTTKTHHTKTTTTTTTVK